MRRAACVLLALAGGAGAYSMKDYEAHVAAQGVKVHEKVTSSDYEDVTAGTKMKKGDVVATIPGSAIVQVPRSGAEADAVVDWMGKLEKENEIVARIVPRGEVELAVHLLARGKANEDDPAYQVSQRGVESGLDAPKALLDCVHADAVSWMLVLRAQMGNFSAACTAIGLGEEEECDNALLYVMQNAAAGPGGALMIFPFIDALARDPQGSVQPGGMKVAPRIEGEPLTIEHATFVVNQDLPRGEDLSLAPQDNLFQAVAKFGLFTDVVTAVPLDLTWGNLPEASREVFKKHNCGTSANAYIRGSAIPHELEVCVRIAAAFQTRALEDVPDSKLEVDANLLQHPYDDDERLDPEIKLSSYELLRGVLDLSVARLPNEDACAAVFEKVPALKLMHEGVRDALKAAIRKVDEKGEMTVADIEAQEAAQEEGEEEKENGKEL